MRQQFIILIFLLSFSVLGTQAVTVLIRPSISVEEAFSLAMEQEWGSKWPEVRDYVLTLRLAGVNNVRNLYPDEKARLQRLLSRDPRSWGHVAIEIPNPYSHQVDTWGFQPHPAAQLSVDHPLYRAQEKEYLEWLLSGQPLPGGFVPDSWVHAPHQTQSLYRLEIPVSDEQLTTIRENLRSLQERNVFYKLPTGPSQPDCYNCVTAVEPLFSKTKLPVQFLRGNYGLMSFLVSEVKKSTKGTNANCHYYLDILSGQLIPK